MVSFSFTLHDPEGFHAKAAGDLVEAALKCSSRVAIYVGGRTGDAKQIFNVMCLGAKNNDEVRMTVDVSASGPYRSLRKPLIRKRRKKSAGTRICREK